MSFLHPWALAIGILAAAPVLLHLLRRETAQRVSFPALRYLRSAEKRTARSMRLRDLLLLAARVLIIALLAVAAARPLAGRGDAEDHAPTDVILLLDNSASMSRVRDGRTLFDFQLAAARTALEAASPLDRFWVVPVVGSSIAAGVDAASAARALDSIAPTDAAGALVARAAEVTTAVPVLEGRVRELQIYSDLQTTGLAGDPLDLSSWGRVVVGRVAGTGDPNGSVAGLYLEPDGAVVPGDPPAAVVRIERGGTEGDAGGGDRSAGAREGRDGAAGDTVEVRLLVDDQTVAMARAGWGSELLIALPELEPGSHVVRVETPASGLRSDDARQLGVLAMGAPTIRHTGPPASFVASALATLAEAGRVRTGGVDPVDIVEGVSAPPAGGRALVLVPPEELTQLPAFDQRLAALGVPWRLEGRAAAGDLRLADGSGVPGLASVRIRVAHGLERLSAPATEDDSVLARTGDGAPWAVRGRAGGRTYVLLASPLHPDATDLPTGVAMVPFLEHVLLRWTRPAGALTRWVDAGTTLALPPRIEALGSPGGDARPVEGGAPWTPLEAGVWTFDLPGDGASAIAYVGVNVPLAESTTGAATASMVEAAFPGADVVDVDLPGGWRDAVFGARRGAEATPWILALLLGLALAELFLRAPGRARRPLGAVEPA